MACRFPNAKSIQEVWDTTVEQKDAITTFNAGQQKCHDIGSNMLFFRRYGSLGNDHELHHASWLMSEEEASNIDPQVCGIIPLNCGIIPLNCAPRH